MSAESILSYRQTRLPRPSSRISVLTHFLSSPSRADDHATAAAIAESHISLEQHQPTEIQSTEDWLAATTPEGQGETDDPQASVAGGQAPASHPHTMRVDPSSEHQSPSNQGKKNQPDSDERESGLSRPCLLRSGHLEYRLTHLLTISIVDQQQRPAHRDPGPDDPGLNLQPHSSPHQSSALLDGQSGLSAATCLRRRRRGHVGHLLHHDQRFPEHPPCGMPR